MSNHDDRRTSKANKGRGTIANWAFFLFWSVPAWIVLTLIVSVIIEWVGMVFWWDQPGAVHARNMLIEEATFINREFSDSPTGKALTSTSVHLVSWIDNNIFLKTNVYDFEAVPDEQQNWLQAGLLSAVYVTKVFFLRLVIFFYSLPAFVLFGLVGVVNGLARRDVRRFTAAIESSAKFNLYRSLVFFSVGLCFFVYIGWPDTINPAYVVIPFAAVFGWALQQTLTNYRKYF